MKRVIPLPLFVIIFLGGISIPTFSQAHFHFASWRWFDPMEGGWINRDPAEYRDSRSISVAVFDRWRYGICLRRCDIGRLMLWEEGKYRGMFRVFWDPEGSFPEHRPGYYTEPYVFDRLRIQHRLESHFDPASGYILIITSKLLPIGGLQFRWITDYLRRAG